MPDDSDARREYQRQWRAANSERIRETTAQWREANRERINELSRQWKRNNRNREGKKAADAAWRDANRDRLRASSRERQRAKRAAGYKHPYRVRRNALTEQLRCEQGGQCYLCRLPLEPEHAVLDHDHRCCPLDSYCSYCVRGAVHHACNQAIGILKDDPELLELVARNLRAKLAEVDERLKSKPEQLSL